MLNVLKGLIGSLLFGIGKTIARVSIRLALFGLSLTDFAEEAQELRRLLDDEATLP